MYKYMGKAIIITDVSFANAGLGKVSLVQNEPLESLSIAPINDVIEGSYQMQVTYNPATTSERGVEWSIVSGSEYASIDQSGLLTVIAGATNDEVVIRARSLVNSSIYVDATIVVNYPVPKITTWYIDNTDAVGQANAYDSQYFPLMCKMTGELDNKVVNRMKFYAQVDVESEAGIAVYKFDNSSKPTLVQDLGMYPVVTGENIVELPDVTLGVGEILGVNSLTAQNNMSQNGFKYKVQAAGTSIDGGWASAKFNGTFFVAIGYHG